MKQTSFEFSHVKQVLFQLWISAEHNRNAQSPLMWCGESSIIRVNYKN